MKRIFVFAILACAAIAAHAAAKWVPIDETHSFDSSSVRYLPMGSTSQDGKDQAIVWMKTLYDGGKYGLARLHFDRSARMMRCIYSVSYKSDGSVADSSGTPTEWIEIIPDSVGDWLFNRLFAATNSSRF